MIFRFGFPIPDCPMRATRAIACAIPCSNNDAVIKICNNPGASVFIGFSALQTRSFSLLFKSLAESTFMDDFGEGFSIFLAFMADCIAESEGYDR